MHLGLIAVVVRDHDPAIRFFVDVLGFELVEDSAALRQRAAQAVGGGPAARRGDRPAGR